LEGDVRGDDVVGGHGHRGRSGPDAVGRRFERGLARVFVPGGDVAVALERADGPLDGVALLVRLLVERWEPPDAAAFAARLRR
jgi:hypothetical protein